MSDIDREKVILLAEKLAIATCSDEDALFIDGGACAKWALGFAKHFYEEVARFRERK